ncbi:hypothetical protein [Maribacter sp. 2210JD10-5]|uniref:hypothetical protein n=1 Tax=Maribacter sp. 2210JD10-5 TaxID=3386272 RepID=UPI0039BC847C
MIKKSVLDDHVTSVQIDANNCFEVFLSTNTKTDEVVVTGEIDGEYSKDLKVDLVKKGNSIFINAGFSANFKDPNDKLSAHKVVAIALKITIPEWKLVSLFGTNTRVVASGNYEKLSITLSDGSCELEAIGKDVNAKTHSGDISVKALSGLVHAKSKYGTIHLDAIPKSQNSYTLNTVTGNIALYKTE